jgi:cobalamin biosynthesis protein CobT
MAKKSSAEGVQVDFGEVESRGGKKGSGGRKHYPEADYKVKVKSAKFGRSGDKETPRLEVTYVFLEGKLKGKEVRDDLYLSPKALWRLRQALEAMGVKVPSKKVKINPATLVDKKCAITLEDEEYDGNVYSKVSDTYTLDDWDDSSSDIDDDEDEDEDDEDEDDDEDDDDEDEEEDDDEEVDLDDL